VKRYLILLICLIAILIVVIAKDSRFSYVRTEEDKPLQVFDETSSVLFVGDSMLGRNVENIMKKNGSDYPFKNVKIFFAEHDAVIANLEGPIEEPHVQTPNGGMTFSFASTTPKVLADHNIKLVSLANNHTGDKGIKSFNQTQNFLDGAGVLHAGAPFDIGEQYVRRTRIGNVPFIFVAFNITNPSFDTAKALKFVQGISKTPDEVLVVMVHGGDEYELNSNTRQKTFYRGLIDSGVTTVIAHHPHVVQEIEVYKNKPIFYSLGNFIFDQYFSKDVEEGLAVRMVISPSDIRYELFPLKGNHSQPVFMNETEKKVFLVELAKRSTLNIQKEVALGAFTIPR
jgi:poly-gamma-glutamate synthesis protein (capsule biosynthesis protein)